MDNSGENNIVEEVKFNAGLDTLKFMSEIMREMQFIAVRSEFNGIKGDKGACQHALIKSLQQYFIASAIVIKDKDFFLDMKKRLDKIQPIFKDMSNDGFKHKHIQFFDENIDKEIWNFMLDLRMHLQTTGLFMPSKKDTMF